MIVRANIKSLSAFVSLCSRLAIEQQQDYRRRKAETPISPAPISPAPITLAQGQITPAQVAADCMAAEFNLKREGF